MTFQFFQLWYVQLDGALFGEAGRVFLDRDEFGRRVAPSEAERLPFGGGGGLRNALSQALVARLDIGFSEDETGILYLAFGQAF